VPGSGAIRAGVPVHEDVRHHDADGVDVGRLYYRFPARLGALIAVPSRGVDGEWLMGVGDGHQLALLFKAQHNIPLNALEGSFMQFSGAQAYLAYAESLAAVSYITDSYGLSDIQRILQRIGQGTSTEAALRATIHSDYGQLESDLTRYLADKYGDN